MVAAAFDPFAPGSAETLALFGARVGGMMLIAPSFSSTLMSRQARVALMVVLTVLLQPAALASVHGVPAMTATAFLSETLIGFAIGFGAALFIGAAETAGDVMSIQSGLSGAAILDPTDHSQLPVLGAFIRVLVLTLMLTFDLHNTLLSALADSTIALPVGVPLALESGAKALLMEGGAMFAIGVRLAAPVIACVMLANVAIAVLGRAAPQLNILTVSFPIQITVGLLALFASLPAIARFISGWNGIYDSMLGDVVRGLTLVHR